MRKQPRKLGHRDKNQYKIHNAMNNIIVGKGELVYIEEQQGWSNLDGTIIKDKEKAIQIATYLDYLYKINYQRKMTLKNNPTDLTKNPSNRINRKRRITHQHDRLNTVHSKR